MRDRLPKKSDRPLPPVGTKSVGGRPQEVVRHYALAMLAVLGIVLLAVTYYISEWKTTAEFASAIDHCEYLFYDFVSYFRPAGREVLVSGNPIPRFFYSAFSAILFVPFGLMPLDAATWCWGLVQVVLAILLCGFSNADLPNVSPRTIVLSVFLVITSFPLLHNFAWGQVSTLITVLMLGSLFAYQHNRRVLSGVLLAVGTSIKYYPAIFAVYYLLKRDFRALAVFCSVTFLLYFLLPVAILGMPGWLQFQQHSYVKAFSGTWVGFDVNSQYFGHVVIRLSRAMPTLRVERLLAFAGIAIACGNGWLLWRIQRIAADGKAALSAAVLFLSLPFLVQTSWPHYFVYLPFCQMVVLAHTLPLLSVQRERVRGGILLAATILSIALGSIFGFNQFPNWRAYTEWGMPFFANALLLGALYGLIVTAGKEPAGLQPSKTAPQAPLRAAGSQRPDRASRSKPPKPPRGRA